VIAVITIPLNFSNSDYEVQRSGTFIYNKYSYNQTKLCKINGVNAISTGLLLSYTIVRFIQ
jgi:hypothetical protein